MQVSGSPESTQITYIRALRDLMEDCGDIPENLSADRIKTHLSGLRSRLSSSPLNLRVCGIKYYFRHVVKRLDLVVDIPNPRVAKYIQTVLTHEELAVLFDSCRSMRELAVFHLLYDCGLRSREVCGIKLSDFEKVHQKLTLRQTKGGQLRAIPYSEALRETFTKYFQTLGSHPTIYLFENRELGGRPLTVRGVQYIVKEVVKRSGLPKDRKDLIHPHTFRHTYAVHYLDNGGNLLRLQGLLGHKHISTTLHYLKFCTMPLTDTLTPLQVFMNRRRKKP